MSPVAAKTKPALEILATVNAAGEVVAVQPPASKRRQGAAATAEAAAGGKKPAASKAKASRSRAAAGSADPEQAPADAAELTALVEGEAPADVAGAPAARARSSSKAAAGATKVATKAPKAAKATKAKGTKAKAGDAAAAEVVDLDAAADDLLDAAAESGDAAKEARPGGKALASIKVGPKGVYTEDSIRVYLQEIGRIRLLRPDEEIELARKIADLLQLEELAAQFEADKGHHPDTKEWAALVDMPLLKFRRRLMLGRRAKEKMVQSNLRLVVSIAKKYMNRGLSFQDLIQEGSLGLIRAAEKFDHEKGYKFSTYATWWIRQAITRAIADQSRTIRLPVHLYETISRIKKTTKTLSQEFGRKPTEEEIAESMEMTIEKLRFIAKSAQLPISLETPIGKEEDSRLGDFIEADIENPEQDVAKNLLREDLEGVLATLSPRERDVLRLRYGLDDGRMKTLEEIGQIFDVTRERIRQIEAKALRKLRHPNRNGVLKEYIK